MDAETKEFIKNFFINHAKIVQEEITNNLNLHTGYERRLDQIVPNVERAILVTENMLKENNGNNGN